MASNRAFLVMTSLLSPNEAGPPLAGHPVG